MFQKNLSFIVAFLLFQYFISGSIFLYGQEIIFQEDFESGQGDWYPDKGIWEIGTSTKVPERSISDSIIAGTVLEGDYPDNANSRLISPNIKLPSLSFNEVLQLRFWHWFKTVGVGDDGEVQISVEGREWKTISTKFNHDSQIWSQYIIDLSAYSDSTVRIGFLFKSNSSWWDKGWYIDDISILKGKFPFRNPEDFEEGIGNWYVDKGVWEVGIPLYTPQNPTSGNNVAGTVLKGDYHDNVNSRLISADIPLIPKQGEIPMLRFQHYFKTVESGDDCYVQISVNNEPWENIAGPFYGNSKVWSQLLINLSAYSYKKVRIGFLFKSNSSWWDKGWYIDNIGIEGIVESDLIVEPAKLYFDSVLVNDIKTKTITVSNIGNTTMIITSIIITGNDADRFSVDKTLFSLEPDSSLPLPVSFTPDKVDSFNATLEIKSNGGNAFVSLSGKGISRDNDPRDPYIANISDIPNDQGKQVLIKWIRSNLDDVGSDTVIVMYGIWRRVDHLPQNGLSQSNDYKTESDINNDMAENNIKFVSDFSEMLNSVSMAKPGTIYILDTEHKSNSSLLKSNSCDLWTFVGFSPAMQLNQYSIVAPTLFDSTKNDGIVWSTFFISAHTDNPQIWFASEPDSGYSVDNLSPAVPIGLNASLAGNGTMLSWLPNKDDDLNYYTIYRNEISNFEITGTESLGFTTDTCFVDNSIEVGKTYFYKLTASDFSGNESNCSNEVYAVYTYVDVDGNSVILPVEFSLYQNYPNPFNPETLIKYQIPDLSHVKIEVFNLIGQHIQTLVDEQKSPGSYQILWNGLDDQDQAVSSGVYLYRMQAGDFTVMKKMVLVR